jgi:16S rRNA A1518/A1519 N6-dimethyltransferase RsmA/KsgA/DIM1 with predicted DNA glycosylase/AP lyase activity
MPKIVYQWSEIKPQIKPENKSLRGFEAKKSLGQNFLVDANMQVKLSSEMLAFASQFDCRQVVEVGPGQGDLTDHFLEGLQGSENTGLVAVEIDKEAVEFLERKFRAEILQGKLQLVKGDFMEVLDSDITDLWYSIGQKMGIIGDGEVIKENSDSKTGQGDKRVEKQSWIIKAIKKHLTKGAVEKIQQSRLKSQVLEVNQEKEWALPEKFSLLSNLPYNLGSRMLMDIAVINPQTPLAVVLQKEVVQKLVATGKNDKFSFFSGFLGMLYDFKATLKISPQCFVPVPKVTSQLVCGTPKNTHSFLDTAQKRLVCREILKNLLAFPNKTLANNLAVFSLGEQKEAKFWQFLGVEQKLSVGSDDDIQIIINKTRLTRQNYQIVVKILFDLIWVEF